MAQDTPAQLPPEWRHWPPAPIGQPRFDPRDPLVSNDYAGWWQRSFLLLRRSWRPLAGLQLLIAVPLLAILVPTEIVAERQQRAVSLAIDPDDPFSALRAALKPLWTTLAGALPAGLVCAIGLLAALRLLVVVATGARPTVGSALHGAVRRVPAAIGWYVVAMLMLLVAFVACFLPVIYVGAALTILPAVVLLERGNAVARCFRLFHTDVGAAAGRIATIVGLNLAASLAGAVVPAIGAAVGSGGDGTAAGVLTAVSQVAQYAFAGLVLAPLTLTAYADLRARHEPFSTAYLVEPAPSAGQA